MVNIEGLDKAEVLMVLFNSAKPQGSSFLNYTRGPLSRRHALLLLERDTYFDYVMGRVMKVDLKSDVEFDSGLYNRDNGDRAAERAISFLRGSK